MKNSYNVTCFPHTKSYLALIYTQIHKEYIIIYLQEIFDVL